MFTTIVPGNGARTFYRAEMGAGVVTAGALLEKALGGPIPPNGTISVNGRTASRDTPVRPRSTTAFHPDAKHG